ERVGWISEPALDHICERLTIARADVYGVATFYGLLSMEPRAPRVIHVCEDLACKCAGSDDLIARLEDKLGPENGDDSRQVTWLRSPCLGQCDRAPAALVTHAGEEPEEHVLAPVSSAYIAIALAADGGLPTAETALDPPATVPRAGAPELRLLQRVGQLSPLSLDDYRAH